ncbi:FecR family protein [Sunxiuqinia sp. sy24]|uniref:FecR family protein n=1 Tax=Sunxiuqinia sp. sy24 TaxID=3461495 RepID=UPI0040465A1F
MNLRDAIKKGTFLGKYITETESKDEELDLKTWVEGDYENRQLFDKLTNHSFIASQIEAYDKVDTPRAWNRYTEKIRRYKLEKSLAQWRIAAILFFIVGLGGFVGNAIVDFVYNEVPENYTTITASNGEHSKITLPDQSTVWLNGGTTIAYNNAFFSQNREIKLNGEAFFQVTKQSEHPFVVHCDDLKVRVLGTSFNVRNYAEDETVSVVLEKGAVELETNAGKFSTHQLSPGEKADYERNGKGLTIKKVETSQYTSWKKGLLIFSDATMSEVVKKLERWYNVSIEVKNPRINNLLFNATILHEDIEDIMELIKFSCAINYDIVLSNDPDTPIKITMY